MKTITDKELMLLGKDLKLAAMIVFYKHGFSCAEIASIMGVGESVVRNLIISAENSGN
jgi:transposase